MSEAKAVVTPSQEDYLKAIWKLSESQPEQQEANTGDLATALGVSPPAVSKMLKQMERQGWAVHTPYYGVRLTEEGRRVALKIVRRHRLLERFLVETLGYSLPSMHDEAERLEHHISDEFERRIDALLGYPRQCPHGSPIPTDDGHISPTRGQPLSQIEPPTALIIERLYRAEAGLLSYLSESRLLPGVSLRLISREPFGGDLQLEVNGHVIRLSCHAAESIIVSKELMPVEKHQAGGRNHDEKSDQLFQLNSQTVS